MDIHVGKMAGTYTVGVLTGNSTAQALKNAGADCIIERASSIDVCLGLAGSRGNAMPMP
jgi:phosphoglycolate phosphatase-like HAD superfamily hydrolase